MRVRMKKNQSWRIVQLEWTFSTSKHLGRHVALQRSKRFIQIFPTGNRTTVFNLTGRVTCNNIYYGELVYVQFVFEDNDDWKQFSHQRKIFEMNYGWDKAGPKEKAKKISLYNHSVCSALQSVATGVCYIPTPPPHQKVFKTIKFGQK